jgi:RimJ/RimL family protein N-acetyltransferase
LVELAKIPAPSNHEEKRAAFCKEWLEKQGAQGVYIDEALNVIWPVGCTENNPLKVFMAHSDVVFPDTEELPLVLSDLCEEDLDALCERYRHPRVHSLPAEEDERALYWIEVLTEAMFVETIPTLHGKRLTLRATSEKDLDAYARLCRDEQILAVWGYDFREDYPRATDRDLLTLTEQEFSRGITLPFFIYIGNTFVGEALLYAFDGRGGAEFAVRILPEHRRLGIAKEAIHVLCTYAREELKLSYLDGACRITNLPSRALLDHTMPFLRESDGIRRHRLPL